MYSIINILIVSWIVLFTEMTILWYIGKKIKNYTTVDIGWAGGIFLTCLVNFFMGEGFYDRKLIILILSFLWSARLIFHLHSRVHRKGEDPRYVQFREQYGTKADIKFYTNIFQFQAILDLVLSISFIVICSNSNPIIENTEYLGILIFMIAIIGESIADFQLEKFKSNPSNKGEVCDKGLWYFSRHPNYFFEILIWTSYTIIAISSPFGYLSFIPTIIMLFFILKFTGIKLTEEQAIRSKGQKYIDYQKTTSVIIPWFKKGV